MRDFSWKYFTMTGNVDAYLLYREVTGDEIGEQTDEWYIGSEEEAAEG